MHLRTLALGTAALLFTAAHAHAGTTGYVAGNPQGCKVWAPLQRPSPNYQPKYTGGCKNGFANGQGHLDWVNTYASNRVTSTWDGYFLDGVFTGDIALPANSIEPQPNANDYWVHLGSLPYGDVLFIARTNDGGNLDLCLSPTIAIVAGPRLSLTDDAVVQHAMSDAAAKLLPLCKTGFIGRTQVNVYNVPYKLDIGRHYPQSIAVGLINWPDLKPASYSNTATTAVQHQQRFAAADAKFAAARKRFDDFTTRNHITSWVTAQQLDANPFKYSGKVVGLIVQLDRMESPNTALVSGSYDGDGGTVQLHGITPDFPDSSHSVLLAVRVGQRETFVGQTGQPQVTGVARLDSATCAESGCYDWTSWVRGKTRIPWGEPYVPGQ